MRKDSGGIRPLETTAMEKYDFKSGSLTLSYLDAGGEDELIIALHAHWMEA